MGQNQGDLTPRRNWLVRVGAGDGVVAPKVWVLEKGWWGVSEMQLCLKGE